MVSSLMVIIQDPPFPRVALRVINYYFISQQELRIRLQITLPDEWLHYSPNYSVSLALIDVCKAYRRELS